jgi:two-component system alkaline phosphatase synthesis response regulator PhoP
MSGGNGSVGGRLRILLIDDEKDLVNLLAFLVEQAGLIPLTATEPAGAIELFEKEHPDLALVDLNLRPWDGFELLADLRRRSPKLPIIVLTARGSEDDKVRAFDLGADDYIVKPFGHRELVARIRAQARRAKVEDEEFAGPALLEVGLLRLDLRERRLQVEGKDLHLTATEFRLLEYLMRNSNSVVPTAALAKYVWGYNDAPIRDVVRVTVHRLRRKLGDDGQQQRFIDTVPGIGLKLRPLRARQENDRTA